jgi:hypothetical protein
MMGLVRMIGKLKFAAAAGVYIALVGVCFSCDSDSGGGASKTQ